MDRFLVSRIESYNFRMGKKAHRGFDSVRGELNQIMERKYKAETIQSN